MNVSNASIESLASGLTLKDGPGISMLRKALDQEASGMQQLLQALPQKANAGTIVDVQA